MTAVSHWITGCRHVYKKRFSWILGQHPFQCSFQNCLKKVFTKPIVYSTPQERSDGFHWYTPGTKFFVDKMIWPEYFKDCFKDTFVSIASILGHCGIYFLVFLFLKLIIDLIVILVSHMETNRITCASLGFDKTLSSTLYNIFMTSAMNSMCKPQTTGLASDAPKTVDPRVNIELPVPAQRTGIQPFTP